MLSPEEIRRYNRHIILPEVGREGQEKLSSASVLVIGAGGLGSPVLQYLAAAGVGHTGIVDGDTVDITNLQRQVLFSTNDTGRFKADAAAEKLRSLNPHILITPVCEMLGPVNALDMIRSYDIIVDGSDNFATRYLVNDACVILGKPFVSGAIYRFGAQVSVFNFNGGPTYRCLYPQPGNVPSCAEAGVLGVLPGVAGSLMAGEAIKMITGAGNVLSGTLLVFDLLTMQFNSFYFDAVPANKMIASLGTYDFVCDTDVNEISIEELLEKMNKGVDFQLIDVREAAEYDAGNIGGVSVPLSELKQKLHMVARNKTVIVHCASGVRSLKAISILMEEGFTDLVNVRNGLADLREKL